jgi:hypothetical protein
MKYAAFGLAALGMLGCGAASAETYVVKQSVSRYLTCYDRVYVPATVAVNTRGKKVRGEARGWEIAGDRWDYVRSPAVYIQTRRIVEQDHYTLVARGC